MRDRTKILVLLTGGTICSTEDESGSRFSNVENVRIIEHFRANNPRYADRVDFERMSPLDVLSENMTVNTWNRLLDCFRSEVDWSAYQGIILLHGTDTLAYTAALLSIALVGAPIPVCMVSAQLPLDREDTNGHANFKASVELILGGIAPNVYAVYRNMDGVTYVHMGAHLMQCASYSNDFFSGDAIALNGNGPALWKGVPFQTHEPILERLAPLAPSVLKITPYVGIDYARISLEGVQAVVHETYHSESVCVERSRGRGEYSSASILTLLEKCKDAGIPLLLAPCSEAAYHYESTKDAILGGATSLYGMTSEMAYVKLMIGLALGYRGEELVFFARKSLNHEQFLSM